MNWTESVWGRMALLCFGSVVGCLLLVAVYVAHLRDVTRKEVAASSLVVAEGLAKKVNEVVIREPHNMPTGALAETDRWETPLRASYAVKVLSAGPDKLFGTSDDVEVQYPLAAPSPPPELVGTDPVPLWSKP